MHLLFWIVAALLALNISFCLSLIFIERKDPTTTWAWLLIMLILPGLGYAIYILFGQNLSREKLFKEKTFKDEARRREMSNYFLQDKTGEHVPSEYFDLIRMNYNHCGAKYKQRNSIDIYYDGEDKFQALIKDLNNAKKFIHIQYYIFRRDSIGKKIIEILEKKAAEGVEIRFLVDSMGSYTLTKKLMKKFLSNGGKFEIFFPGILPHINTRINYRNHRKIVVIDGESGYIGGFNVGKEYINQDSKIGFWRDTHIRIKGEAVNELTDRFLLDWCYASGEDIDDFSIFYSKEISKDGDIGIQIVTSGPDHKEEYIKHGYLKMINNAKKSIYLQTPYFVPDEPVLEALKLSALSGVDVRIIIPENPDHIFMKWASNSYIGELLDLGVKIYAYENGFIHAKTIVVDGQVSSIGTANMDIRSFKLNFEVNAFIFDDRVAENLEKQFFVDIKNSKVITKESHDNRSIGMRMKESLIRLLSPIL
ncbi:cardiolipin synthase [Clostridium sp. SHJSY1]|uniref:cardiolipin synthase n=1 Tax=Clostridium sp. SHJSY1 TaxID=2942483 RepID=UPI0028771882|nr:cardiolipin synthase [Clostridium sp. SHJSY1]MDS0525542.1 cardiolipin synthase [Clostridium sp. SHJSY1]